MNVVVVGAGIAGSSLVRALEARGERPVLIGTQWCESLAALALLRRAYHSDGQLPLFDRSVELYARWGVPIRWGAQVTNYRYPDRAARWDQDWGVIEPALPLRTPDRHGTVYRTPRGILIGTEDRVHKADLVLWAGGAAHEGTGITYGTTWIHDSLSVVPSHLTRVHHIAPYKSLAVAPFSGGVRLGSSSAATEAKALEQGRAMLQVAYDRGLINTLAGWKAVTGRRCKGTLAVDGGIHHVFAGFHRTGYALVPALAEQFVTERLEKR